MLPQSFCLSTIESTAVVLELLVNHGIEQIDPTKLKNFLNPFKEMVAYQKRIIQDSKSLAVRFRQTDR